MYSDMALSRGRGRGACETSNSKVLRRPGEAGLLQRLESLNSAEAAAIDFESELCSVCEKIVNLNFDLKDKVSPLVDKVRTLCHSVDDMEKCIDSIFVFATKSKWNAHVAAMFFNSISDITVEGAKLRTHLLRKLQAAYKERNKKYLELDKFLMDVTFLCEIFHHIRIEGKCLMVLSRPVNDYFGMLIDGASQKEVEVFLEQFPKCYRNLKENDEAGLDTLISKLRKQIICEPCTVSVRAMLLQIFEQILMDFKPLSDSAKNQYESVSKPPIKICD